jgi:hypothetical protein
MRRALSVVLLAGIAAPASAADLMVVGRSDTLVAPRAASSKGATVKVAGKHCKIAGQTALAALARTSAKVSVRDYGACGRRTADATGLYVTAVDGERERGTDGWVYKLDDATPSIGAADPSGRFAKDARVLWFWCRGGAEGCQRTLTVTPQQRSVAPGGTLTVRVQAFDDLGRGVAGAGARVTLGSVGATANGSGVARLTVPSARGKLGVVATQPGRVRSFPAEVTVG